MADEPTPEIILTEIRRIFTDEGWDAAVELHRKALAALNVVFRSGPPKPDIVYSLAASALIDAMRQMVETTVDRINAAKEGGEGDRERLLKLMMTSGTFLFCESGVDVRPCSGIDGERDGVTTKDVGSA